MQNGLRQWRKHGFYRVKVELFITTVYSAHPLADPSPVKEPSDNSRWIKIVGNCGMVWCTILYEREREESV